MPSKREYEEMFNKLLGTSVRWSNLTKEDLVQLATLFNNPEVFLKRLGLKNEEVRFQSLIRKLSREGVLNSLLEIAENSDGPIVNALKGFIDQNRTS